MDPSDNAVHEDTTSVPTSTTTKRRTDNDYGTNTEPTLNSNTSIEDRSLKRARIINQATPDNDNTGRNGIGAGEGVAMLQGDGSGIREI